MRVFALLLIALLGVSPASAGLKPHAVSVVADRMLSGIEGDRRLAICGAAYIEILAHFKLQGDKNLPAIGMAYSMLSAHTGEWPGITATLSRLAGLQAERERGLIDKPAYEAENAKLHEMLLDSFGKTRARLPTVLGTGEDDIVAELLAHAIIRNATLLRPH